jgi:CDP-6-deoxy-D-xylo-4-hexulose-3-dehydrase
VRLLFAGNYMKHPAFIDYVEDYRVVGELKNTDFILKNTFWVGVTPMLQNEHLDHIIASLSEYCQNK